MKISKKVETEVEFFSLQWDSDIPAEISWDTQEQEQFREENLPQKYIDMLTEIAQYLINTYSTEIE